MNYIILLSLILLFSCELRDSQISNQIHVTYRSLSIDGDKKKVEINTDYIGGSKELWTEKIGFIRYKGTGILLNGDMHGQGNATVPIRPYKLLPGDKNNILITIDDWSQYKSYEIQLFYYKNEIDCKNKNHAIACKNIVLK